VSGEIIEMVQRQQTSLSDGTVMTWDDGSPRMMLVITLQTDLGNGDDDNGERTVFVRGGRFEVAQGRGSSLKDAIGEAVRAEGLRAPRVGDHLSVGYTGVGKGKRGYSPPKLYTAGYQKAVSQEASGFFES
jgi:hypothetical protein